MAVTEEHALFAMEEYRKTVADEDLAVQVKHPLAREGEVVSFFDDEVDAEAENTRQFNILKADNKLIDVPVPGVLKLSFGGMPPRVTIPVGTKGLLAGGTFMVVGSEPMADIGQTRLRLLG